MRKIFSCFLAVLCFAGCATTAQMDNGLNALHGENIQTAFDVLGYPSRKQEFNNDIVYSWRTDETAYTRIPQTTTTTGFIGNTPLSYQTTSYDQVVPYQYRCTIKIATGQDDIIKSTEYEGNSGACDKYIRALGDYYKSVTPAAAG